MDNIDRLRFEVLDHLIRKTRYRGLISRRIWKAKNNPHRPPLSR